MKQYILILTILITMPGIIAISYAESSSDKTSITEVKKETHDLLQALKSYTVDQRDQAIQKSKAALDNMDKRINTLEAHIENNRDKMSKVAREKASASLESLRKQRAKLAESFTSLKNSSSDAWVQMKKGFSDAYVSVNDAWEKAKKEFESDQ